MLTLRDLPLRRKLLLAIVGTTALSVFMVSVVYVMQGWLSTRTIITQNITTAAQIFGMNATAALSFNDVGAAEEILSSMRAEREVGLACLYRVDEEGSPQFFAGYLREGNVSSCPDRPPVRGRVAGFNISLVEPVTLGTETIGWLYIEREMAYLRQSLAWNVLVIVVTMLLSILLAALLSTVLQRLWSKPLLELVHVANRVSREKDYSLRAPETGRDEIGQLLSGFNVMLAEIEGRDRALASANNELELRITQLDRANRDLSEALDTLRKTQEQLVNAEKMAALGGLVAGVAHEINTPVGVGVTAASTLKMHTEEASSEYGDGKLTNSGLLRYFEIATKSSDVILSNLNRAAELIQSFKQVAVDQSSSESRLFNVRSYIDEILTSLAPKLKKTSHRIVVDCDRTLEIYSIPGTLSQILTNLIMNSLSHAYDEGEQGTISIQVALCEGMLELRYSDDGKGIPAQNLKRVFEPFFTTRRGAGGSGLGMHIVYNLVTQQLRGEVSIASELGAGTEVRVKFPVTTEWNTDERRSSDIGR